MIGHVTLTSVDSDRAAAHSKRVVDGVARKKWNYQGVVMTDDLVMGAICRFRRAQFYRIFTYAVAASAEGRLDAAMLGDIEMRLKGAVPGERQIRNILPHRTLSLRGCSPLGDRLIARAARHLAP
jgi:beta-N-acetylhexosaminidase